LNKSLQPDIPAQPDPVKLCYIGFITDKHQLSAREKDAPNAGPRALASPRPSPPIPLTPSPKTQTFIDWILVDEYPFQMHYWPDLTRLILVDSGRCYCNN